MTWLVAPDPALHGHLPADLPRLRPAAPEDAATAVAAGECGEDLVPIPDRIGLFHVYSRLPLRIEPPPPRLRSGVVARLLRAQDALPPGFGLCVLDGWRTPAFQGELWRFYREASGENLDGYVSDPDSPTLMAPHVTGGAVDLTLSWHGDPLALGTDFDSFDEAAHLLALEDVTDDGDPAGVVARDLRRLLGAVLVSAGFGPYPLEWWHWSHGEQRWAAFIGESTTAYSPVHSLPEG